MSHRHGVPEKFSVTIFGAPFSCGMLTCTPSEPLKSAGGVPLNLPVAALNDSQFGRGLPSAVCAATLVPAGSSEVMVR